MCSSCNADRVLSAMTDPKVLLALHGAQTLPELEGRRVDLHVFNGGGYALSIELRLTLRKVHVFYTPACLELARAVALLKKSLDREKARLEKLRVADEARNKLSEVLHAKNT